MAMFDRPAQTKVVKRIKTEPLSTVGPISEVAEPSDTAKKDQLPAAAYVSLQENEFRILRLAQGRGNDKVVCSFFNVSILDPPQYEAISYLWGGNMQHTSQEIELQDSQQPPKLHRIFIRSNLHAALRSLRHPAMDKFFWVDALCIDRSKGDEKNQQTDMKRIIFYKAVNLCFWLGEDPAFKTALSFIPQILDLSAVDKLVEDRNMMDKWLAFVTLLKNKVFSRLWLVQEVAIAQNVTLHCGAPAIHYADLVDAVTIFVSCRSKLSIQYRDSPAVLKELTDRRITMAERFIDVTTNALQLGASDRLQSLFSLEILVSKLSDLGCGDPRDRIYSVLALAKDHPPSVLEPSFSHDSHDSHLRIDYHKDTSIFHVYKYFFLHVVRRSTSLDIICRRWSGAADKDTALPTWIRPLQPALQPPFDPNIAERTDADSLVGTPDSRFYDAARGTCADIRQQSTSPKSLLATGFGLDIISRLGPRASEGIILKEWLELGGCTISDEEDTVPEAFWRTLVADRGPNGASVPSWYHRALLYCLANSTVNGDINTIKLIEKCEKGSSLVVDFLQRVQSVIWNRKLLVSKQGWIGIAPMAALEGDAVCILHGCSVPVVLRSMKGPRGEMFWYLIGECYVHGMMDGEAMELRTSNNLMIQEFDLR